MKREEKSFNEYWEEVGAYVGIEDTINVVGYIVDMYAGSEDVTEDWEEDDEIIEFRDSVGCLISAYNRDKEIAIYE